jgi:ribosome-associated heat shock protein Hsp15
MASAFLSHEAPCPILATFFCRKGGKAVRRCEPPANASVTIIEMTSVRIDKWLWAARFFKTRALASKACDLGRIHSNAIQAKPARDVRVGDMLTVRNEGGEFQIEVLVLSEMRGPAAVAQTLYRETEASKEARLKLAAERKAMQEFAPLPEHRPSKRDRRRIIQFRGER